MRLLINALYIHISFLFFLFLKIYIIFLGTLVFQMGSTLMFRVRICQKPLTAWFIQGPYVFTSNTPTCKWQPCLPARFLCTKESVCSPHSRDKSKGNSAHAGAKRSTTRHLDEGPWDVARTGRGKPSSVRHTPAFPKSVFAAGTAKRTAEILRRKSALRSQDGNQVDVEESRGLSARGAGRGGESFYQVDVR